MYMCIHACMSCNTYTGRDTYWFSVHLGWPQPGTCSSRPSSSGRKPCFRAGPHGAGHGGWGAHPAASATQTSRSEKRNEWMDGGMLDCPKLFGHAQPNKITPGDVKKHKTRMTSRCPESFASHRKMLGPNPNLEPIRSRSGTILPAGVTFVYTSVVTAAITISRVVSSK